MLVVAEPTVTPDVTLNKVAPRSPVDELNVRFDPVLGAWFPVAAVANTGKQVVSDDSSARLMLLALVAVVAEVAEVADVALPLSEAVMVPALKLPDPSLKTMVDAVLLLVALD